MRQKSEKDSLGNELFLAGETVPPGRYKQLERPHIIIELKHEDVLPASLDGRVTCYIRIQTWRDIQPPAEHEQNADHTQRQAN